MTDTVFLNGAIAVKEKKLLGDRLLRLAECDADGVLRALNEAGFGGGAAGDVEFLCNAENAELDKFIREYAPTNADREYLLSPRDFHNAKAACKARILSADPSKMLAPEGCVGVSDIISAVASGEYGKLPEELAKAVKTVMETDGITGAEIGAVFDAANFSHLAGTVGRRGILKKLLTGRADMTNILTAMRAGAPEEAARLFVTGGALSADVLLKLRGGDEPDIKEYAKFYALCKEAKERGKPFTEAERALDSFEAEYFAARRYELSGREPFLYYVFRRRAEISDVRIIAVCSGAGLDAREIKKRLRAV